MSAITEHTPPGPKVVVAAKIPAPLANEVRRVAVVEDRTVSALIGRALRQYVRLREVNDGD